MALWLFPHQDGAADQPATYGLGFGCPMVRGVRRGHRSFTVVLWSKHTFFVLEVWLDVFEVKMVGSCQEWFSGCFLGWNVIMHKLTILDPFCYCLGCGFVKKRIFFGEYPSLPTRVFLIWEEQCTHISSNSYDCYATLIFASSPLHRTRNHQ